MSDAHGPDAWQGLLDPDEKIIWQGAPAPGVSLAWDGPFQPFFFIFFTGFSVFWMLMASQAPGPFWMFGLLFFGVGMYNLVGIHFWKAYARSQTYYTLTSKRTFIGRNVKGKRSLDSYAIGPGTTLSIEEGRFADIWFAETTTQNRQGTTHAKIGFERLTNGREVFAKLREVQQNQDGRITNSSP